MLPVWLQTTLRVDQPDLGFDLAPTGWHPQISWPSSVMKGSSLLLLHQNLDLDITRRLGNVRSHILFRRSSSIFLA